MVSASSIASSFFSRQRVGDGSYELSDALVYYHDEEKTVCVNLYVLLKLLAWWSTSTRKSENP